MATYGKTTVGAIVRNSGWEFSFWANFNESQQIDMPVNGITSSMKWYGHVYAGGTNMKAVIYEIDEMIRANSVIIGESNSTFFDADPGDSTNRLWHTIPIVVNLEAGKKYALGFSMHKIGSFSPDIAGDSNQGNHHYVDRGRSDLTSPDPLGVLTSSTFYMSIYVDYEEPSRVGTSGMYAPADAIPMLTDGRNTSDFSSGHSAKYTLDNDPDTWWEADSTSDTSIYYDLETATAVDAISIWLHNYNEAYDKDKAIQVSYSSDDITYIPLSTQLIDDIRTAGHPIAMYIFNTTVTSRYWKISFQDFDNIPIHERVEVSGVWFVNPYPLPFKHQRPQKENIHYFNDVNKNIAGIRYATTHGKGSLRKKDRNYKFFKSEDQYSILQGAHRACKGRLLPCFLQCEYNDNTYYALHFTTPLTRNEISNEYFDPTIGFIDKNHLLIPLPAKGLYPIADDDALAETVGWWKFADRLDSSGNDLTLTASALDNTKFIRGVAETGITAIPNDAYTALYLLNANATPMEVNVKSFWTIEFIICSTDVTASQQAIISKWNSTPTGWFAGLHTGKVFFRLSGDSDDVSGSSVTTVSDGKWHYIAITIDRSADEVKIYIDGTLDQTIDINTFGGDSINTEDVTFGDVPNTYIDEIMFSLGSSEFLTATGIQERAENLANDYGTWGL